jgi:hypothetical protein
MPVVGNRKDTTASRAWQKDPMYAYASRFAQVATGILQEGCDVFGDPRRVMMQLVQICLNMHTLDLFAMHVKQWYLFYFLQLAYLISPFEYQLKLLYLINQMQLNILLYCYNFLF